MIYSPLLLLASSLSQQRRKSKRDMHQQADQAGRARGAAVLHDVLDDVVSHGVAGQLHCIVQDVLQNRLAHVLQGAVLQQPLHHPAAAACSCLGRLPRTDALHASVSMPCSCSCSYVQLKAGA